ncbi:MAG: type 1 glutamine amidotransferase [Euryarchaeota archaeon]|nr:type 1 glutamine amidotransferase [Euryarchaeota archaeon]
MTEELKKVGVLVEDDYEDLELWYPYYRLLEAGYDPVLIGPKPGTYRGKHGYQAVATLAAEQVDPRELAGLIVPGGFAPDRLRTHGSVVELLRIVFDREMLVASICHGGSLLVSANVVRGRKVTSYRSIEMDLINAGARYIDRDVVVDGNIVTSRRPDDLPSFMREVLLSLKGQRTKSD